MAYYIKVWELKKDLIINKKLYGLYPLLPLMQVKKMEMPEDIIKKLNNNPFISILI